MRPPQKKKKYPPARVNKRKRIMNTAYLVSLLLVFETIGLSLVIFPREEESVLEQRKLAKFPELTAESWFNGEYTSGVNKWFTDTVPFRDNLTVIATALEELNGFRQDEIRLHNVTGPASKDDDKEPQKPSPKPDNSTPEQKPTNDRPQQSAPPAETTERTHPDETQQPEGNHEIAPPENEIPADDAVNITNNGIAVIGSGANTRALMLYGGSLSVGESYAKVINKYKEALGDGVNVYSMVIPTAAEFYSPPAVQPYTASQLKNINNIIANLSDNVRAVDVYTPLSSHTNEYIYTRTDHHWSALGAYYAAQQFAQTAGVPFMDISQYEQRVVHDYVGTMYSYSGDVQLLNNPEDFYYYVPQGVDYTCTYYNYILDENGSIIGMEEPYDGSFFIKYSDGNSMAYCTYMGGDAKIVHVSTGTNNGRKLAIFKDSYGNALPPFLFGSFEDIYVIDMRYFTYNAVEYLTDRGITDVLFANNAFHAATASTVTYYERFLTMETMVTMTRYE